MKATITLKNDRQITYKNITYIQYCQRRTDRFIYLVHKVSKNEIGINILLEDISKMEIEEG